MQDERPTSYSLDPDDAGSAHAPQPGGSAAPIKTGRPLEPLPLADDESPAPSASSGTAAERARGAAASARDSIHALDVCPNCGANMPGSGTLVCLRCGFDLKTLKVIQPQVVEGEKAARLAEEEAASAPAVISEPGRGDWWLPAILGTAAALIMLVSYVAGYVGLYHPDEDITIARRMLGLLQYIAWMLVWTGMGLAAIAIVARSGRERLGDLKLAAARMAGIVAVMSLVALLNFGPSNHTIEVVVELIAMGAVFMSLVLVLYNLDVQRAGMVTAVFAGTHMLLLLSRVVIAWLYTAA